MAQVGALGVGVIVATLAATFLFTTWLGRLLGVDGKLAQLIAAGTSICGASAVIATNTVTDAPDEDVAYAVACVTVFGSIAMFVYPAMPGCCIWRRAPTGCGPAPRSTRLRRWWRPRNQGGREAGDFGTIAKLSRVMLLAPVVITLGMVASRRRAHGGHRAARAPMPWFVLGFIALVGLNSIVAIPAGLRSEVALATTFRCRSHWPRWGWRPMSGNCARKGCVRCCWGSRRSCSSRCSAWRW